jgi:poly-gamma-glutamate synthesis protein (capsule biosynthesis protein)
VENLARTLIDAGADVIVGDGPHLLQGIEIHNGKPIFYSLGNFFYQSETIKRFPPDMYLRSGLSKDSFPQEAIEYRDAIRSGRLKKDNIRPLRSGNEYMEWYEAVAVEIEFDAGELKSIRLHPLWTHDERRSQRGLPRLACPETSGRILDNIQEYSSRFDTLISREGNTGIISL